jgi:enterochelin esterase-like enzyme
MNDLLQRAKKEGTPLIDGNHVTFVWQGETAPDIIGDFNGWGWSEGAKTKMEEVAPEVWTYTLELARSAYVEYFYTADPSDHEMRILDPFNKRRTSNGMGKFNNYFNMPETHHTRLVNTKKTIPHGTVTHHQTRHPVFLPSGKRDVWLYQPPVEEPVPLVLVYDGREYYRRAKITQIVDNLIAQRKICPVALAMVENAKTSRFVEYAPSEAALVQVMELVLPLAKDNLKLLDTDQYPGAYGVLGSSLGGLMALYTAVRLPHIFGKVLCQSGAFQLDLGATESLMKTLLRALPKRNLVIWQDVGRLEWLLHTNRDMNALLTGLGYQVTYEEFEGGHNYVSWRDMLPRAFETCFGLS